MAGTVIVTIGTTQWTGSYLLTESERVAGLAHVASIPAQTCAFFGMGVGNLQTINVTVAEMLFPLDIVFLQQQPIVGMSADGHFAMESIVVQIERNVVPGTGIITCPSADAFMEVNGGEMASVNVGDTVRGIGWFPPSYNAFDISSIIQPIITIMVVGMMVGMMRNMLVPGREQLVYGRMHNTMACDTRDDIMASARDELGHAFHARIAGIRGI